MSEQGKGPVSVEHGSRRRGGRRRFFGGLAIGGLLGTLAATSWNIWANEGPGGGWHGRGWCKGHSAALTPEERAARADQITERVLSRLDATAEQKVRVKAIVQDAIQDLGSARDEHLK